MRRKLVPIFVREGREANAKYETDEPQRSDTSVKDFVESDLNEGREEPSRIRSRAGAWRKPKVPRFWSQAVVGRSNTPKPAAVGFERIRRRGRRTDKRRSIRE